MTEISSDFNGQTVICTFEMTPATADELMEKLQSAYSEVISKAPGFVGAGLHMNDARTRIATYSKWAERGDYQAMLRSPEMIARNRVINTLCRSFEPVMYEVAADF
ncbi:MAG: antibiotic biosynthesis monooxygenase [Thioclava marina]|jgi:Antibiotic biosynthesis monooxygenase.|uniref:Antibiotic biosynthesis monooxygenase n=1 Tax=Thioclava marina TaxID=1915077 RepID=A0ABX3MI36_9RHOB|nr:MULTISPECIES: antibiotic biosynthesis monooxygenase [Thioclava]TNE83031.1 MAG: antibiotic biosynthesis monooxygenase [Paracoccaceae bacterium]MBC7144084.1 antibiotic biosynthesis monooxygenase [Thioclava marina]MBD3803755.1 antibiotic biosynthesis monooxygenase [Thioclava sp.]OOY11226.1 antibiotic biosynthesis monooxygenase [Thioclava marina]OOY26939.1 antibiotic biosynthesis monooxygenase [Thioclava sp. L04-15]